MEQVISAARSAGSRLRGLFAAAALAAAGLAAVPADAVLMTQTVTFGPAAADVTDMAGTPGALRFFDTALGTLNAVVLSSSYGFRSDITVSNTGAGPAQGRVQTESGARFGAGDAAVAAALDRLVNTDPAGSLSFGAQTLSPIAYDLLGTPSGYLLDPGGSRRFASNGSATRGPSASSASADLAAFARAGGGAFDPFLTTLTGLDLSVTGGNAAVGQATVAQASLTIGYDYTATAVPEATSWAMILAGFGAIGMGLRSGRSRRGAPFA